MAKGRKQSDDATWADQLRAAVESSPMSHYAICQAAGIERSMLARFMQGAGIGLATAEKIGRVVGLKLVSANLSRKSG